jgi:hypothetical protein
MQSCAGRESALRETFADLAASDWDHAPIVEIDACTSPSPLLRQRVLVRRILERAVRERADFLLLLEDDLEFNQKI